MSFDLLHMTWKKSDDNSRDSRSCEGSHVIMIHGILRSDWGQRKVSYGSVMFCIVEYSRGYPKILSR